jgi:hypothetical protein
MIRVGYVLKKNKKKQDGLPLDVARALSALGKHFDSNFTSRLKPEFPASESMETYVSIKSNGAADSCTDRARHKNEKG